MAEDKPNFLEEIRETLAKGGADILGAVTGALDNFSLTGEKLNGVFNKYFGSEPETLTAYRDANPTPSNAPSTAAAEPTSPSKEPVAEQISGAMPQGVEDAVKLAMRVTSTSVSNMVGSMQSMSEGALSTLAAAQGGAPAMAQAKTTNQSAGNAPSFT